MRFLDLTGQSLTCWSVLERGPNAGRQTQWWCQCVCGTVKLVNAYHVREHRSKSCGCVRDEETGLRQRTHGMSRSPEYGIWLNMKRRCLDPGDATYPRYGGRGMTVCERWQHSFEHFIQDMGRRPSVDHRMDRMDNALGYTKDNCRWTTIDIQNRNKRRTKFVTLDGSTMCLMDGLACLGMGHSTFRARRQRGWEEEEALLTPLPPHTRKRPQPMPSADVTMLRILATQGLT